VLADSHAQLLATLPDSALVLDVGGGARPFERADWVIDLLPYGERSLLGGVPDPERERFSAATWIQRDICDRDPWPFADARFDFSVCSHTLEDVRDPLWVCQELMRVSRAGYIEVPSRLEEQSHGFQGPWVGWGHHRWLIDIDAGEITFVFKHHVLHGRRSDHFPRSFHTRLTDRERVSCLWWEERFAIRERIFLDAPGLDAYLAAPVRALAPPPPRWRRRLHRLVGR
jgi:SAM-dependent methyltransferase